jgi:lipopolysaccharide transport system permease protein
MIDRNSQLTSEILPVEASPSPSTRPVIKIRRRKRSFRDELSEIGAHRELLFLFVWRDLKLRYKQTILGVGWAILQPVLMTLVFAIFLGLVVRVPSGSVPYPLFAYSGLLVWIFFSQTVLTGSQSLSGHAQLINKVYFPRIILPLANSTVRLIDFLVATVVLAGLMVYYGVAPGWNVLLFPVLVLQLAVLAFGLSTWLAVLNLKYRDVGALLPIVLQVWMFASPIVYPSSLIADEWRGIYFLNPVAGIVENLRASMFNMPLDENAFWTSIVVTVVLTIFSLWFFFTTSRDLADVF